MSFERATAAARWHVCVICRHLSQIISPLTTIDQPPSVPLHIPSLTFANTSLHYTTEIATALSDIATQTARIAYYCDRYYVMPAVAARL